MKYLFYVHYHKGRAEAIAVIIFCTVFGEVAPSSAQTAAPTREIVQDVVREFAQGEMTAARRLAKAQLEFDAPFVHGHPMALEVQCKVKRWWTASQYDRATGFYVLYECSAMFPAGLGSIQLQVPGSLVQKGNRWVVVEPPPDETIRFIGGGKLPPTTPIPSRPAPPVMKTVVGTPSVRVPPPPVPTGSPEPTAAPKPSPVSVHTLVAKTLRIADESVITLPGRVVDMAIAGCGRYLVLAIEGRKSLLVYDGEAARIVDEIRGWHEDTIIAAGGNRLVLYSSHDQKLIIRSLDRKFQEQVFTRPLSGMITEMVMGSCSDDRLVVRTKEQRTFTYKQTALVMLALPSCEVISRLQNLDGSMEEERFPVRLRASPLTLAITAWAVGVSPAGLHVSTVTPNGLVQKYDHRHEGALIPDDCGRVFTASGLVFSRELTHLATTKGFMQVPTTDGRNIVGLNNLGDLVLYDVKGMSALARMGTFPGATFESWGDMQAHWSEDRLTLDRRVICSAEKRRCLFLSGDGRSVVRRTWSEWQK